MNRRVLAAVAVVLLVAVGGALGWWFTRTEPATWSLAQGQQVGAATIRFTVVVQQTGCNDGATNPVHAPDVALEKDKVVVTFAVDADRSFPGGAHSCPGGPGVRYDVVLPEPLGARTVHDGTCPSYDDVATACRRIPAA